MKLVASVILFCCILQFSTARNIRSVLTCEEKAARSSRRIGAYTPQCDEYGNYEPTQTHGSTGYSWCVDILTGVKIVGSELAPAFGMPDCRECEKKREVILDMNLVGADPPECADDGKYALVQTSGSSGHSWCADPDTGVEVEGTRVGPGQEPDCYGGDDDNDDDAKTCEEVRDSSSGMPGSYTPQCDEYGNYEPTQSHGSTGYTWCVDIITGVKIEGSELGPGFGTPDCRDCERKREVILGMNLMGADPPECADDGKYALVQTSGSSGHSWCADPDTGVEVEGTRVGPGQEPDCSDDDDAKTCAQIRDSSSGMPGSYTPQCDEYGNYEPTQSHGSTGYTWCADIITGEKIEGSELGPGFGTPDCRDCERKREVILGMNRIGADPPECSDDGKYELVQSNASTGYSWCVDTTTGEEVQGTRVRGTPIC